MLNFGKTSHFPNHTGYYNIYRFKVLFCNTPNNTYDLKVKVTDLELLCLSVALKIFTAHIFQTTKLILCQILFKENQEIYFKMYAKIFTQHAK